VIDRSRTRDIPEHPAATETAELLGVRVAETISGADIMSVQTGHMIASDPTTRFTLLASQGPSTYGCCAFAQHDNFFSVTYLRLMRLHVGLLINFGAATFREGIHRIVNELPPSASPRLRVNLLPTQAAP